MENPAYKKNFLTEVIVKIDFAVPLQEIEENLPQPIAMKIARYFPISQPQKGFTDQVQVTANAISRQREEFTEWTFFGKDRKKVLKLSKTALLISYNTYESFGQLRTDFSACIESLFNFFPAVVINRLGLRYINNISISGSDPLNWKGYINSKMIQMFTIYPESSVVARGFQIIEYNFGDYLTRFQFGMHNPDFPSPILKKIFVIDTDIYQPGLIEQKDLLGLLEKFHEKAFELFELSIGSKLRTVMNA